MIDNARSPFGHAPSQPAPGITVRQRVSVKQTAKGEFTRDYTVEVAGPVADAIPGDMESAADLVLRASDGRALTLRALTSYALERAEADWAAHVDSIREAGNA